MPPTLILLPGLHGTADLFKPFQAVIPPHIRTRAIAYPTDRAFAYKDILKWVEDQLQDERDMVLLGESFSGPLALRMAAAHPDRVRALVLCVSFVAPPVPRLLCYLATPLILLSVPIPNIAVRIFLSGYRTPRDVVANLQREVRRIRPWVLAQRVRAAAWIDASAALNSCRVPIFCLHGANDRLIGPRSIRRIRRIKPDVTSRTIDGPHLLLQVKPAEAWQEISQFLTHQGVI